jgi:hypothetical protein
LRAIEKVAKQGDKRGRDPKAKAKRATAKASPHTKARGPSSVGNFKEPTKSGPRKRDKAQRERLKRQTRAKQKANAKPTGKMTKVARLAKAARATNAAGLVMLAASTIAKESKKSRGRKGAKGQMKRKKK